MKVAIMQPYLFPYIGYWQLIQAVDVFVIYDDVNYIKNGYINRNSILNNGKKHSFTIQLSKASSNKLINEISINDSFRKLLKTIRLNYSKSAQFPLIMPLLEDIFLQEEKNLARFIAYSLKKVANYLAMNTKFVYSSELPKNNALKGQDKVIDIVKYLKAKQYINAIGGQSLYSKEDFLNSEIELHFIKTNLIEYQQFNHAFVPYLSMIDLLMFNDKKTMTSMLNNYELI